MDKLIIFCRNDETSKYFMGQTPYNSTLVNENSKLTSASWFELYERYLAMFNTSESQKSKPLL